MTNEIRFLRCLSPGLVVLGLSGCALVPGLHPSVPGGNQESAHVEVRMLDEGQTGSGNLRGLRIVTLNPAVLVEEARQLELAEAGSILALPTTTNDAEQDYVLGAGDVLNIVVWEHPELTNPTGEFRDAVSAGRLISADGTMFYPYVGAFRAAGMSVAELRSFIARQLASVIKSPQVDVRVVAYRSKRIQVSGEVAQPGIVTLDDTPKGLIEALNERGGLTDAASRRRVILSRAGEQFDLDLARLLSGNSPLRNPALQPGDLIHVPDASADQVFVLGEVNKEGPVTIRQSRLTLVDALAQAEGFDKLRSNDSGVLIFRRPDQESGMASLYRLDMSSAVGVLVAGEFELQRRDVVYVGASAFSKYNSIINQLLPTISAVFQVDRLTAD